MRSIAFPAISTGIYGYPAGPATEIAVAETRAFLAGNDLVSRLVFACFDDATAALYRQVLGRN